VLRITRREQFGYAAVRHDHHSRETKALDQSEVLGVETDAKPPVAPQKLWLVSTPVFFDMGTSDREDAIMRGLRRAL
jgi:hypothetical protein